jgi:D-lactate dehydrogenase
VISVKIAIFDTHPYDRESFEAANAGGRHQLDFLEPRLTADTAVLARGNPAVCPFVNDELSQRALAILKDGGTQLVAMRSAGYNHVDLDAAAFLNLRIVRVPEYSPHAVAEHAVALVLALDRKIHRAHARVREWNFSLDGLVGFDLHGKTVGIAGTGRIGRVAARIFHGFGCRVLACDLAPDPFLAAEVRVRYVGLDELYRQSDIVSLHVPLTPATHHMIDASALSIMKPTVFLVNTGRGALIDSRALIDALKTRRIAAAGLDVYEEEEGVFYEDLSNRVLEDDVLARLITFPNVLVTAHQAFLTREALANIARTTLDSVTAFERGERLVNEVRHEELRAPRRR